MFDLSNYVAAKAAGTVTQISSDGSEVTIVTKSFNPVTGEQEESEETSIAVEDLAARVQYYETSKENFQAILDDAATNQQ
jgi:hypothetical protein